jgi:hypothetical protein
MAEKLVLAPVTSGGGEAKGLAVEITRRTTIVGVFMILQCDKRIGRATGTNGGGNIDVEIGDIDLR